MTIRYADTFVGVVDGTLVPATLADGRRVHAEQRVISSVITLASQAIGDQIYIGKRPRGSTFLGVSYNPSVTLGSSTLAAGSLGTAAKYGAATTVTNTNQRTSVGAVAAIAAAPSTDDEDLYLTVAAAALPASGTLIVDYNYCVAH